MSRLVYGWLTALLAGMPPWLGYALADAATGLHWWAFPARRRAVLANLAVILPRASVADRARIGRRMVRAYNRMMFEFFRLPHLSRERLLASIEVSGREHFEQAIARGRGVLLVSTHLGNWELGGVMIAQWGHPLHAVAGVQLSRWLSSAVRESKSDLSLHTISPQDGFRKILRALDRNEPVALMVDGDVYTQGHMVDWFGRPTPFPAGPGTLAQRTGALVVCGYCVRTAPGRFRVVFEPPIDPAGFSSAEALHQAIAAVAERHIRQNLEQWCIFRPLWNDPVRESAPAPAHDEQRVSA